MMIDTIVFYILIRVWMTVTLSQGHSSARKQKLLCTNYLTKLWLQFGILLRLVGVLNHILILSHLFNIQGRESCMTDFVDRNMNVGLYSDIYRHIFFFKLCIMIETARFYVLISAWMTLTFIQGHSCIRNKKIWCPFSRKFKDWFRWNSVYC